MEAGVFLERVRAQRHYRGQMMHEEVLPARPAIYADVAGGLHPALQAALERQGIGRLYCHQAEAVHQVREGHSLVVVTGTASGKTLCYNLPVVETLIDDSLATMLFLYPTKALAQDQLRALDRFQQPDLGIRFLAGTYDGDTPQTQRRKLRDGASVVLTNPDMLHQGILPQHPRWNRLFTYLRYIVIDEVHAYRGVFGSHLANVLRRLDRICRHYGSSPQFICCSATIANPKEHAERITGREVVPITQDGSPRGPKRFVLWNPPPIQKDSPLVGGQATPAPPSAPRPEARPSLEERLALRRKAADAAPGPAGGAGLAGVPPIDPFAGESNYRPAIPETAAPGSPAGRGPGAPGISPSAGVPGWRVGGERRSSLWEAVELMTSLVREGAQSIAFVRTRLAAELIFRHSRELLRPVSPRLAEAVHAYRGGYLPEERRQIEKRLVAREILGIASTNALELGIDIGTLDACILVGYPGTVASLWQQAGRAGRGQEESIVFLVAQNAPMDQYLMAHSGYLFAQSPEQAVVDPDNPHIAVGHLKCAAHELPLADEEAPVFGEYGAMLLELLEEDQSLRHIDGHWYWARSEYPAAEVNLRNIAGPVYTIQDESQGERVIGTVDEVSALSQLHDHAVYLHGAETYFVDRLDTEKKVAHVERRDLDYYTQSIPVSHIRVDEIEVDTQWQGALIGFGDVTVTTSIPLFKKIRFHSRDSLGFEQLELPPQSLETVALWFSPPEAVVRAMAAKKLLVGEALVGIANVLVEVAPFFVMCDLQDVGTVVDANSLGRDTLFLYDRYPGGMGYARRCLDRVGEVLETIYAVIRECGCEDGCPSCVGSAIPPFAMTDLDSGVRGRIPDKAAARFLLSVLLDPGVRDGMPPAA